ncbi:MAG: hypothetical protein KGL39_04125 [Patescibacteria group bacterium]|nr:hypothetical protein [Patescibacteria group bacterium]
MMTDSPPLAECAPSMPLPKARYTQTVGMLGVGRLADTIGQEEADEFFHRPSPYDEARLRVLYAY